MKLIGKLSNFNGLFSLVAVIAIIFVAYKLGIFEKAESAES